MDAHQSRHHHPYSLLEVACGVPQLLDARSGPAHQLKRVIYLSQCGLMFKSGHDSVQLIGIHRGLRRRRRLPPLDLTSTGSGGLGVVRI